ncbi:MAG: NADH-quinone oxidoreductase subunit L, partial [Actinomycetota bacterium]|nr:NADH-quinone oxidoreductase subunit L [Actinomycetota bacterium]
MLWLVPLLPVLAGPAIWLGFRNRSRVALGGAAAGVLGAVTALAAWVAATRPDAAYRWGAGLTLRLAVDGTAATVAVLVPAVALVVVVYASAHEEKRALGRLVATLVGFVGAMELLVLAGDMLTLLIGWELVGGCSWALIAHEWWESEKPAAAAHAFGVTRLGDLGLFAAAGAAFAATGSLSYTSLAGLDGGWLHVFVAGVVLAAAAKSAQVPFSPWLFSAMAGPTSVSALLHAATMVAAGAYALVRLHPVLDRAAWFGPVVIGIGLATALVGGVVATLQTHAKKLLAASTSAQYGLMFVAAGAGYPAAALAHLTTHAALKAGLFMAAGVAIEAVGHPQLARMGLGAALRVAAAASAVVA